MTPNKKYGGNMTTDMVVIGGSAGSLQVVLDILPQLKKDLRLSIVIIFHRKAVQEPDFLVELLGSKCPLQVKEAEDKEPILQGVVYLAAADYHLFIEKNLSFSLDISEKINFSRPSIDLTFQSAADTYQEKLVGVLLSGANADGVTGMQSIKLRGGYCIAQDPVTCQIPYMPAQAIAKNLIDQIATPDQIAQFINSQTAS
ncbi:chemotaxis protein CheB [Albibacterium profundi]|uniref:protein-glutamate methylesterase n=1 Tax=Albibacterium profundi TaxID=3134906 RepID=A0ABV5CE44_9SPHI